MNKKLLGKIIFCFIMGLVIAAYVYLTLNAPSPANTRPECPLTGIQKILMQFSFIGLMVVTWILGAVAVWQAWYFSQTTNKGEFDTIFKNLSFGVGILLSALIVATLIGQIRTYHPGNEDIRRVVTIAVNYVYVFAQFLGFWFFYKGFAVKEKKPGVYNHNIIVGIILTLVIGSFWVALIFSNPTRQVSGGPGITPSFYISDLLIIATIILPTLLGWFFGITSSLRLADFSIEASDVNYQKAFSKLVSGVWLLILGFIILLGI